MLITILLFINLTGYTQVKSYWVEFTDKNNSSFSVNNPEAYLSQRTLQRRAKYGIPILENDLPVNTLYIDSVR
ncbi:MAG: peptidase S8, partial [Candidatus Lokiarchaeia archaeon]|nr:peptidase S8 [Candidatus Lokiarchaeia archaeon]